MPHDTGILTYLLNSFLHVFSLGFGNLKNAANSLLYLVGGIDLVLAALFWALRGDNVPVAFVRKILHIGFFLFLVASWPTLTATVLNGFVWAGKTAGGGTTVSLQDPSSVISAGFDAVQPISNKVSELVAPHWWSALANMDQLIWYGLSMIITLVAFCVIGVQCFIAYLEFYIVAVLMLIMVPFGIFRHTAFLSEKAIGAIISHGVKLMVLAFIIAAAAPIFAAITPPNDPTITVAICTALGSVAIMLLAWHAPSLASGMLSGGPSLTAGTAAGAAIGVAAGAAALGAGAIGAGAMAGKAASGTASATIKAAGALSEGARMGAASMAAGGGAGYSEMAAGAAGGMMQVAGNAAVQPIRSGVAKAGDAMRQKFNDGRLTGYKYMGGAANDAASGGRSAAGAPAAAAGAPSAATPAPAPTPSPAASQAAAAGAQGADGATSVGAETVAAAEAAATPAPPPTAEAPTADSATTAAAAQAPAPAPAGAPVSAPASTAAPKRSAIDPVQAGRQAVEKLSSGSGGGAGVQPSLPKDEPID
ncbi:P-type conjugative transfer protein TrbL [Xanthomonas theicola]|uniref:P-type conjugative transfer protein TrbL n=1 Tax=Xanthomonas theicola TaxID=56464 RepID=A0A2S6ZGZ3_9XANT|nr:P-type conjugative transfer protein TrbL [Xanthomonas theicola]PPT91420.1 P-type conjugative transfer protein TrbL [Xanthomonas theicola]QNH27224.1 P-type conjugative transfer protein TrbL [Xanthomonas theicola]